jgi:hypothetical protein
LSEARQLGGGAAKTADHVGGGRGDHGEGEAEQAGDAEVPRGAGRVDGVDVHGGEGALAIGGRRPLLGERFDHRLHQRLEAEDAFHHPANALDEPLGVGLIRFRPGRRFGLEPLQRRVDGGLVSLGAHHHQLQELHAQRAGPVGEAPLPLVPVGRLQVRRVLAEDAQGSLERGILALESLDRPLAIRHRRGALLDGRGDARPGRRREERRDVTEIGVHLTELAERRRHAVVVSASVDALSQRRLVQERVGRPEIGQIARVRLVHAGIDAAPPCERDEREERDRRRDEERTREPHGRES